MKRLIALVIVLASCTTFAHATADFVEHIAGNQVFGEPAGVTMREQATPRDGEPVDLWVKIGFSFFYTDVAIYYTTDGSTPSGAFGVGSGTTQVLRSSSGGVTFVRNQPNSPSNIDWWRATLPLSTRAMGTNVRYQIGAWHSAGGIEVFANNYGCADNTCNDPANTPTTFAYTVKLAWPGAGAGAGNPAIGYPPVSFWKEEGVVGNNYINVMVDQNGTIYDVYYPSAGCVQGVGTKNEGYVDGLDTFPPGLPPGFRGQMHLNQAMPGIRYNGVTYWLSNQNGVGYSNVTQEYADDTNTIRTNATLTAGGGTLAIEQYDFSPKGITFPNDNGGQPNRGIYLKRMILTNSGVSDAAVQVYFYGDFAINGGDGFDGMFTDAARGAMVAFDNTGRMTSGSGEYNPTTFSDYNKNVSIYLGAAMKALPGVGVAGGTAATDFWSDTSGDQGQGWIGQQVTIPAGQSREVNFAIVGGFDNFAGASGTYAFQVQPVLDWFLSQNVSALQSATDAYWTNWLDSGVTVDLPDDDLDELFRRGLLATALHLDGENGGLIAGMHNGAYPFIWPRDAVYGAITLARTGHAAESAEVYRFLRDVAFRANDVWGKGFWYQKYTTDGYVVWSAPQVDETSAVPWGVWYQYLVTGDLPFLNAYYTMVYEAGRASSEDSSIDTRLYFADPFSLMHSNNVWEDAFDTFIYSNASVERGLRDAASAATALGNAADAALFNGRAGTIHSGVIARLNWNGENTDISQLGLVYPFDVFVANDPLVNRVVDRINGVAGDNGGNIRPLVNFSGEFQNLINRYFGDTYWNGGPWHLSTAWYGAYYAMRQDLTAGRADIDNHLSRMNLLVDRLGPIGLGAEQIAPSNSLLFPGQSDFRHQAAWPNAWESMSTFVDCLMLFLDFSPEAHLNRFRVEPKLPTGWSTMTFSNLRTGAHRFDVNVSEVVRNVTTTFTNRTGAAVTYTTVMRVPAGARIISVRDDGVPVAYTLQSSTGRVEVSGTLNSGAGSTTVVNVNYTQNAGDLDGDGDTDPADLGILLAAWQTSGGGDLDGDGDTDPSDLGILLASWGT